MPWRLIPQVEWIDFIPYQTLVRQIKHFPVEDKTTRAIIGFGRLPRNVCIFQIIVESNSQRHRLKARLDHKGVKYTWQQPDRMEQPKIRIGLPKGGRRQCDTRREIVDVLAPKIRVAGYKTEFRSRARFHAYISRILGEQISEQVIELFDERLAPVAA